jgi:hypothetical protein
MTAMRLTTAILTLIAFATFFSLPAWNACRKRGEWFAWDWGVSLYPVLLWLLLFHLGVGAQRPGNYMELALVGMAVMPASYFRAFGLARWIRNPHLASLAAIALTLLFALAMRLIMPPLL